MSPLLGYHPPRTLPGKDAYAPDAEVVELPLLLPRWQALALEQAAEEKGLTSGQMIRRLIGESLASREARRAK
jgi:hypothetical protein